MWKSEWEALSTRIAGIVVASQFLFQTAQAGESDSAYSTNILIENCEATAQAVLALGRYGDSLPSRALDALKGLDKWWTDTNVDSVMGSSSGLPKVQALVVLLASVKAEFDHVLADHDAVIRSHVMRGFLHLQRSLIVDKELRDKWLAAFEAGETACEQLGALHLLLHGIWAFKVSATGERTDLVLGTQLVMDSDIVAATHGLVLTEWKLVKAGDSPVEKAKQARIQADHYGEGSLAGFELKSERYLVLVGKEEFTVPQGGRKNGILYKVLPLFLTKQIPSVAAKRDAKK